MSRLLILLIVIKFATSNGQTSDRRVTRHDAVERIAFDTPKWTFKTNGKVFASPVIVDDLMFIGSEDKNLYAIEVASGSLRWKFQTGGAVHSSVAYNDGVVYFGSFDGNYYAVDIATGNKLWSFATGGEHWMGAKGYFGMKPDSLFMVDPWEYYLSSPVLQREGKKMTMYFGSSDGHVYALNAKDGSLKWKYKTENIVHSTPVISGNKLFVGSWDTFLYALDVHSGDLIWKFKTGDKMGMSGIQASPVVDNGMVYFGARDAHFYALDVNTGDVKWKIFADNAWILSSAALQDGMVYFGTSDSYLVLALDAFTGKEKWRAPLNGYVFSSPLLYGDHLFVGDYTGSLYALSLKDGSVISQFATASKTKFADTILNHGKLDFMMLAAAKDASQYSSVVYVMDELYKLGPIVSSPVVRDKTVYVGSADGNVYSIPLRFGNF